MNSNGKSSRMTKPQPIIGTVKVKPHPGKPADRAKFKKGGSK
jgi:hypothetical protein